MQILARRIIIMNSMSVLTILMMLNSSPVKYGGDFVMSTRYIIFVKDKLPVHLVVTQV